MDELELVTLQAAAWGLRLDDERLARLEAYARLLAGYEEANVIGTREVGRILLDHVLDSLSCFSSGPWPMRDAWPTWGRVGVCRGYP